MDRLGYSRHFLHLMSQSRHWSVSQSANKASGVCSCCQAVRQLHIKDGTVHSNGPRNNPCPGSHKLPLGVASAPSNLVNQSTSSNFFSSNASHCSSPNLDGTSNSRSTNNTTTSIPSQASKRDPHPTVGSRTGKHIPKPARSICASKLAEALNDAVKKPGMMIPLAVICLASDQTYESFR